MDLAKLGIEADVKDIERAIGLLTKFADVVAPKAEKAAEETGDAADKAGKKFGEWGGALGKFQQSVSGSLSPLNAFKGMLIGIAATASFSMIGQLADGYTQFTNRLKVAKVQASEFANVQDRLSTAANENGTSINSLASLYARMSQSSATLGASQSKLLQATDGIAAALKVNGGSAESTSGALMQLGQALGSGTVRAEEFNSMLEGAPELLTMAANGIKSTGGSVTALRNQMLAGNLTSKQLFDGILAGSKAMQAQAASMGMTIGQGFQALTNGLTLFIGQLDQATGASSIVAAALAAIGDGLTWLGSNLGVAGGIVSAFGVGLAAVFGPVTVGLIVTVATWIGGQLVTSLGVATGAARAFAAAIMANPLIGIPALIIGIVTAVYAFREELGLTGGKWDEIWGTLQSGVSILWDAFKQLATSVYDLGAAIYNAIGPEVISLVSELASAAKTLAVAFWDAFGPGIRNFFESMVIFLKEVLGVVRDIVTWITDTIKFVTGSDLPGTGAGKITSAAQVSANAINQAHTSGGQGAAGAINQAHTSGGAAAGQAMGNGVRSGGNDAGQSMKRAIVDAGETAAQAFERLNGRVVQKAAASGVSAADLAPSSNGMSGGYGGYGGYGGGSDLGQPDKFADGRWHLKHMPDKRTDPEAYAQYKQYQADNREIERQKSEKAYAENASSKPGTYTKSSSSFYPGAGISGISGGASGGNATSGSVTIVNSFSPDDQLNALSTRKGRDTIANVIKSNPQQFNAALGNL